MWWSNPLTSWSFSEPVILQTSSMHRWVAGLLHVNLGRLQSSAWWILSKTRAELAIYSYLPVLYTPAANVRINRVDCLWLKHAVWYYWGSERRQYINNEWRWHLSSLVYVCVGHCGLTEALHGLLWQPPLERSPCPTFNVLTARTWSLQVHETWWAVTAPVLSCICS